MTTDGPLKYAYCPFDESKCFQTSVTKPSGSLTGLLSTTISFGQGDSCAFKLSPQDSDLYFLRSLSIKIDRAIDVDCKIYHSVKMDEIETDPIDCTGKNTTSFEFASNEHVAVII